MCNGEVTIFDYLTSSIEREQMKTDKSKLFLRISVVLTLIVVLTFTTFDNRSFGMRNIDLKLEEASNGFIQSLSNVKNYMKAEPMKFFGIKGDTWTLHSANPTTLVVDTPVIDKVSIVNENGVVTKDTLLMSAGHFDNGVTVKDGYAYIKYDISQFSGIDPNSIISAEFDFTDITYPGTLPPVIDICRVIDPWDSSTLDWYLPPYCEPIDECT